MDRRIIVVASYAPSLVNFRGELLARLRERGFDVLTCAPAADPALVARLEAMGLRFHPIPLQRSGTNPFVDLRALHSLTRLFLDWRPETVFAYTVKPILYASLAARIARVPRTVSMVTGLGSLFLGRGRGSEMLKELLHRTLRFALSRNEAVVFQNPDDLDYFTSRSIVRRDRTLLVRGSGVDLDRNSPVPPPAGPPTFLMIARLLVEKGVRDYACAAAQLRRRGYDATCELVGPLERHPRALSPRELDGWTEAGHLQWHGEVEDVRPFLRRCGVYVLPSYREGTPRSVLEAMATGRAIVTTDVPGCRETVLEGRNGFLVPPKNPTALADAMERFLDEPELVETMGRASRALAEERFDVHAVNDRLLLILDPPPAGSDPSG